MQGKGSSFQVIRQGEVQDLASKGEGGFLRLLEHVAGTSLFDEKLSKMDTSLQEAFNKKATLAEVLSEIEQKLQGLKADKEAYKEIEEVDE